MKRDNQYIIPFKGLSEGEHDFSFEISDTFFEEFSSLDVQSGLVKAEVVVYKKSSFLELDVDLSGELKIQCDRCLEYFTFPLEFRGELFVKFKESPEDPDENVIFLHPAEDYVDLTQYFLDSIGLSIPIQKIHPDLEDGTSGCDEEMLQKLDELSYREQKNNDGEVDPRWSKLNDLLNEGNKN